MTRKSTAGNGKKRTRSTQARPSRAKPTDAMDSLIAASAHALRLPVEPDWHASVRLNLRLIFTHVALVDEFPLPDESEPAPVFHA
jgi:hypothetical protein